MQRFIMPAGLWYWRDGDRQVVMNVVNDLYHYDVYDRVTGKVIHKGDSPTMDLSKGKVFAFLATS
jgi:hypothetical protein